MHKFILLSVITLVAILGILLSSMQLSNAQQMEWKNYTNDRLQISFEYPSNWTIEEKENRFEEGPEVVVYNGLENFKVVGSFPLEQALKVVGFQTGAYLIKNGMAGENFGTLIEDMNFNKYNISGKETGSFLYVTKTDTELELPTEVFLINNESDIVGIGYQNTKDQFDSPISQTIKKHIINSFKILN